MSQMKDYALWLEEIDLELARQGVTDKRKDTKIQLNWWRQGMKSYEVADRLVKELKQ